MSESEESRQRTPRRGTCPYCGENYSDPNGVASNDYMRQGHILNDCPNPNKMVWAWLNASPQERQEVWPNA